MTTTSRAHAFTGSRTRIHTPPRRLEMHASATLARARLPVGVFSRCVCFFEATSKKLSDSTLLGPLGVGRVASTAFYSFFSPSLPPSFSEPRSSRSSSSSSRSCRDPGFIILSRCGSIWIDFGGAVHRVTRWMTQKERAIKKREVVSSFPRRKEKKEKNQKSPSPPLFFWFFGACDKMIRVISKTFCRTEEEAWKSAFWGDPNSPTDDFNKREEKKKIRGGGGGQRVVVFCVRC